MHTIILLLSMFLAIYLSTVNTMKFIRGHTIPAINLMLQTIGIVGVIYELFLR